MNARTIAIFFLVTLALVIPLRADKVLVVSETGSATSPEVVEALSQLPAGSTADVLPAATVSAMASTPGALSAYRAVILADPNCGSPSSIPALAPGWANDITGNVLIIGTDEAVHLGAGGAQLIEKGMAYVLANPSTGAFISLSCYFDYPAAPAGTPVPLLDNGFASSAGNFTVHGTSTPSCLNAAHITATHPALAGLTDGDLSNWGCSVHEAFDSWPADFVVLAIAEGSGASYTAPDGRVGSPYILARGDIEVLSAIELSPPVATNELGTTHTVTATIDPAAPGITVTFTVITGPNVGLTGTAVTNASGQASFTYASTLTGTDFIVAQFTSGGVTQTSNTVRKEWVHTPKACMRILQSEVRCETDDRGFPTGNYVWTFRVQNLSGTPASHLFISGLPAGVTATPDHLVFNPPLTGISAPQQVVISNAAPGPLTLTASLHDAKLAQCCSARVTLDLPSCDCAQMVREGRPSCFWPIPPPYKYSFIVQNLSSILAEKVLVAAVSPIDLLTPIPPSQLQVTAAVNDIPPTGPGASAPPLTLLIGGPLATGGRKVCLNISLNDDEIDDCCAITRCFTLPECWIDDWEDDAHAIGGATLTPFGRYFRIDDIGSTGEDGVRIETRDAERAGIAWEPLDPAAPDGAFVELRASTGLAQPGGRVRVTKSADGYGIATDIDGADSYRVEVYDDGELVGTTVQAEWVNVIVIWPVAAGAEIVHLGSEPNHGDALALTLETAQPVAWRLADGVTFTGDRLRILSDQPLVHDGLHLESIELRAANLDAITVTGISVAIDCNGNGIPDGEDIAAGTSLDQNGNGIPDECDGSASTLVLNTGFDDVRRTTLPGGSDDDDWHIVAPAPERAAKVVNDPVGGWPAPLPQSRWISADANRGVSPPGVSRIVYQRCFCLAADAGEVAVDLSLRADDTAVVTLNGQELGSGGAFFAPDPLALRRTGSTGDGLFVAGTNCLRVEVIDSGAVVTGFTLEGTVTSTGAGCAPSHHDD